MKLQRKLSYIEMMNEIERHKSLYLNLYITRNMTARKVCENQNIEFTQSMAKALCRQFPKGLGLGGQRPGSGNKKGVRLRKKDRDT